MPKIKSDCGLKAEKRKRAKWCVVHAASGLTVMTGLDGRERANHVIEAIKTLHDWTLCKDDLLQQVASGMQKIHDACATASASFVAGPAKPKRDIAPKGTKAGTVTRDTAAGPDVVPCYHVGSLAVHRSRGCNRMDNTFSDGKCWSITHAATGKAFGGGYYDTKGDAANVARYMGTFNIPNTADMDIMNAYLIAAPETLKEFCRNINRSPRLAAEIARTRLSAQGATT